MARPKCGAVRPATIQKFFSRPNPNFSHSIAVPPNRHPLPRKPRPAWAGVFVEGRVLGDETADARCGLPASLITPKRAMIAAWLVVIDRKEGRPLDLHIHCSPIAQVDAAISRISAQNSWPDFRRLGRIRDTTKARHSCRSKYHVRRARPRAGSRRIFLSNILAGR